MNSVLVTGANRGIGLEIVRQYSKENWRVFACCRNPETSDELQSLCDRSDSIRILKADVTKNDQLKTILHVLKEEPIDLLINNAGIFGTDVSLCSDINEEEYIEVFKTNTIAPLLVTSHFLPQIEKGELKVIAVISSTMGSMKLNNDGGYYMYRSSKAAVNAIFKSLAVDLRSKGIIIVMLHPGWVKTDMGGEGAAISPEVSVKGLRTVLNSLTLNDSGSFIGYDGANIPW